MDDASLAAFALPDADRAGDEVDVLPHQRGRLRPSQARPVEHHPEGVVAAGLQPLRVRRGRLDRRPLEGEEIVDHLLARYGDQSLVFPQTSSAVEAVDGVRDLDAEEAADLLTPARDDPLVELLHLREIALVRARPHGMLQHGGELIEVVRRRLPHVQVTRLEPGHEVRPQRGHSVVDGRRSHRDPAALEEAVQETALVGKPLGAREDCGTGRQLADQP